MLLVFDFYTNLKRKVIISTILLEYSGRNKKIIRKIWKNLKNKIKDDNPNIFSFDEDICIVEGNHKIYNSCISEPYDKKKRKKTFYQKNNVINNNWN